MTRVNEDSANNDQLAGGIELMCVKFGITANIKNLHTKWG